MILALDGSSYVNAACWCIMLVLIAQYSHGHRREKLNGREVQNLLPKSKFLTSSLQELGMEMSAWAPIPYRDCDNKTMTLVALARISQGELWSPMMFMSSPVKEQWLYFLRPEDAFTVQVDDIWPLCDKIETWTRNRIGRNKNIYGDPGKIRMDGNDIFINGDDVSEIELFYDGRRRYLGNVLGDFGMSVELTTLAIVEPLAHLLLAKKISHIVLLARWQLARSLWKDWPPTAWVTTHKACYYSPNEQLSVAKMAALANDLRAWAPCILDEDDSNALSLDKYVRMIDTWHSEVSQEEDNIQISWYGQPQRNIRYGSTALLSYVMCARGLKQKDSVKEQLKTMLQLLPESVASQAVAFLQSSSHSLPVWDYRLHFITDASLMVYRRRYLFNTSMVIFALTDSSPQVGHDWQITKVKCIHESNLDSMFQTVKALASGKGYDEFEDEGMIADESDPELQTVHEHEDH